MYIIDIYYICNNIIYVQLRIVNLLDNVKRMSIAVNVENDVGIIQTSIYLNLN